MGLLDSFKHEFVDIIEWTDNTNDTLIWKFPRFQNEIKMGAKLTVRDSQQAIFLNEGVIADVYQPGLYTLQTENMPILTTLKGWKYGFSSPFKADVFFVSTKQFIDQKWGTQNPVTVSDERFGMIEIRAFGTYAFRVVDGSKFIKEITGTDEVYTTEKIGDQLRSMIASAFSGVAAKISIENFASNLDELSHLCQDKLNADFEAYGLQITKFLIENVSMPDDLKKEIFDYSRLNKLDIQKLAQLKTAQSIETAAANQGLAGAGIGMGVGIGMGNMFSNAFNTTTTSNNMTPPPLPQQFFVAVNGQQTGPFGMDQIGQMALGGTLTRDSLVWKAGMATWAAAGTVVELSAVFHNVPPPIIP